MKRYTRKPLSKTKALARKLRETRIRHAQELRVSQNNVEYWKRSTEAANARLRELAGGRVDCEDWERRIRLTACVLLDARIVRSFQTSLITNALANLAGQLRRQAWLHMLAPTAEELQAIYDYAKEPPAAFSRFIYEWLMNRLQEKPWLTLQHDDAQALFFSALESIPEVVAILRKDATRKGGN